MWFTPFLFIIHPERARTSDTGKNEVGHAKRRGPVRQRRTLGPEIGGVGRRCVMNERDSLSLEADLHKIHRTPLISRIDVNLKMLRRQPWFVATLSWLFPGAGQLFSGAYWRALAFVLLAVFFHAVFVLSCIRSDMSLVACLGLRLCGIVLPAAWAARDAYKLVSVPKDSAAAETRPSDAASYFSAFLSTILPGLGQAYTKRYWNSQ